MRLSSLSWLIIGAVVGFLIIVIGHNAFHLTIESWLAALITSACAVVGVSLGPTQEGELVVEDYPRYPTAGGAV